MNWLKMRIIDFQRITTTYAKDFFEIEYHLDPETDCVLATTINDSPLNLYVFKSEDAFICFGYLTGDHTGVITHRINKQGKMERGLNIESDVLMYYPENRPEE